MDAERFVEVRLPPHLAAGDLRVRFQTSPRDMNSFSCRLGLQLVGRYASLGTLDRSRMHTAATSHVLSAGKACINLLLYLRSQCIQLGSLLRK